MSLRKQQSEFAHAVGLLILYAYYLGYEITIGDVWAKSGHKKGSFHYKKLAVDINLFDKNGKYLRESSSHLLLGKYWESLGGTWGGRFRKKDGNHYSWGER